MPDGRKRPRVHNKWEEPPSKLLAFFAAREFLDGHEPEPNPDPHSFEDAEDDLSSEMYSDPGYELDSEIMEFINELADDLIWEVFSGAEGDGNDDPEYEGDNASAEKKRDLWSWMKKSRSSRVSKRTRDRRQ